MINDLQRERVVVDVYSQDTAARILADAMLERAIDPKPGYMRMATIFTRKDTDGLVRIFPCS